MGNKTDNTEKAQEEVQDKTIQVQATEVIQKEKVPMTFNRVQTPADLLEFLKLQKAELGGTLKYAFLTSQRPSNGIYIADTYGGINLSILQKVAKVLESLNFPENDLSNFDFVEFLYEKDKYILTKSDSQKKSEMEHLQETTGASHSTVVEDVGNIRIIYFPVGKKSQASDCPLYKML